MISRPIHRSLAAISIILLSAFPIATSVYVEHRRNVGVFTIGERVHPFAATLESGDRFVFDSSRTKKLLLLFYSSSCSHCRKEIINIDSLYRTYSKQLEVIGICIDGSPGSARWNEKAAPAFPIVSEGAGELARDLKIAVVPSLYCIDEDRVLRYRSSGESSFHSDSILVTRFIGLQ
jgi:peroxiredoxin